MKFPYTEKVLDHFKNPRNVGRLEDANAKATEGSPACGDQVSVYLKVDEKTNTIENIKFESYGCASNIATGSIITELAKGKTLDEAKSISWQQASEELGGLPPIKAHCSVLAVDGLRAAIENYEETHGLVKQKKPTNVEEVRRRLKKVMNPLVGLDLVKTELVTGIMIEKGKVTVAVDLPSTNQFANNIREEIMEKISPLWDVNEVEVRFTE
ncbi:iron-sulfur cluster assembly scaffold protein [Candidatus Bipolaricaulota bacterium]|nr:iron-sulfur cluster assembly scaffold protein [Candidatus Bipolaricaulota bacterium]